MNRLVGLVAAAALSAVTVAHAETVKVGLIGTFTGGFANWGKQFQNAVEAFQAVNGTSVNGNEVEVIYRDDGGPDPAKAKQLAEDLILRDKVKYLTGFTFTPSAAAVADLITEANIPTVIMNAAGSAITRSSPMFVRVSVTLPQETAPLAQWTYDQGIRKVYILVADYGPGKDAEEQFKKTFAAAGGEIVASERTPISNTDFAPFMENVLRAKPDALFIFQPGGATSIAALNAFAARGLKDAAIQLLVTGETQEIYLPQIGDSAIDTISSQHYSLDIDNPENALLQKTLIDKFGADALPDIASVAAWDGMRLIYDAIAALGPDADGAAIIDFMKGRKLASPRGPIMIDPETRDIVQNIYIRKVVRKGDKLVNQTIKTIEAVKDPWKENNPE